MKKHFTISFLVYLICQTDVAGQIIEDKSISNYDSILLSQDCNLTRDLSGKIFTRLEILAAFPGGSKKWFEYANKNFDFNYVIQNMGDTIQQFQDSLIIKFIVTRVGNICNINVKGGNPILSPPTLKLLKSSPAWTAGVNGGRLLNAYRTLRIDVVIDKKNNLKVIKPYIDSYLRDND